MQPPLQSANVPALLALERTGDFCYDAASASKVRASSVRDLGRGEGLWTKDQLGGYSGLWDGFEGELILLAGIAGARFV